jgi:uncharacterized protein with NRDE domain
MCLILLAWQLHSDYPLVLAANRDEVYRRPTLPLAAWRDTPHIIGGRDLEAGGGWLACRNGCDHTGRFAAVTNVRQGPQVEAGAKSRGQLVVNYLQGDLHPIEFIEDIDPDSYAGFNLLLGHQQELYYYSNRNKVQAERLQPGIYGLSNHRLDTPWPKLVSAKKAFTAALATLPAPEPFFQLLADQARAPDHDLPHTGVPLDVERLLSAVFIASPDYGTRASTLLLGQRDGHFNMLERSFGANGRLLGDAIAQVPDLR